MTGEKCYKCDRADCPTLAFADAERWTREEANAERDCDKHALTVDDWRAEVHRLRAEAADAVQWRAKYKAIEPLIDRLRADYQVRGGMARLLATVGALLIATGRPVHEGGNADG